MKTKLLIEIKKRFPNYRDKSFTYEVSLDDLKILFDLINENIFGRRLDKNLIDFIIVKNNGKNPIGTYTLSKNEKMKSIITIYRHPIGDNFGQIASVLCHEMIHAYDRYFGELQNKINTEFDEDFMDVINANRKQFVNGYDVHGKFFEKMISTFDSNGITVKVKYNINDNKLMKKIDENQQKENAQNESLDDSAVIDYLFGDISCVNEDEVDDPKYKEKLQGFYDGLENCEKNLTYIDKDHWAITIE